MKFDIQLARLDTPVELNTSVSLKLNRRHNIPRAGDALTTIGMGQIEYHGPPSKTLHDVVVQSVPNEECDVMMVANVYDSMLCAAVEGGGKDR